MTFQATHTLSVLNNLPVVIVGPDVLHPTINVVAQDEYGEVHVVRRDFLDEIPVPPYDNIALLKRVGVDGKKWAEEWCAIAQAIVDGSSNESALGKIIDPGWMVGWFANAIEAGKTDGRAKALMEEGYR